MNKREVLEKVSAWLKLYSDEYDFNTRWYTHQEEFDIIASKTACIRKFDDRR